MDNKKVLIVYATSTNSTKSIADSMKVHIESQGYTVDVIPASGQKINIIKYSIVLIGSAIQADSPLPEAISFIEANRSELNQTRVAVFAVCSTITSSKTSKYNNALTYSDKVAHGLKPVSKIVLAGNFPSNGKKFDDYMAKLFLGIVPGDYRDWPKIKQWTIELVKAK
jgi:menaquinone-dependent protoporphyrinogen IX oxidase